MKKIKHKILSVILACGMIVSSVAPSSTAVFATAEPKDTTVVESSTEETVQDDTTTEVTNTDEDKKDKTSEESTTQTTNTEDTTEVKTDSTTEVKTESTTEVKTDSTTEATTQTTTTEDKKSKETTEEKPESETDTSKKDDSKKEDKDKDETTTEEIVEELEETEEVEEPEYIEFDHAYSDVDTSGISTNDLFVQTSNPNVFTKNTNVVSNYEDVYIISFDSVEQAKFAYTYYFDKVNYITDLTNTISLSDEEAAEDDVADLSDINEGNDAISNLNNISTGNYSGYIALIDSGANADANFDVTGTGTGDSNGHGTRMLQYIKEENPSAKVMSIKAFNGASANAAEIYAAIKLAIESNVSVINLSFVGSNSEKNAMVKDAINDAIAHGITVIGAAGNYSTSATTFIPGCISNVITVGAVNEDGTLYEKSNYNADVYVVAESTSEATARYSGMFTSNNTKNDRIFNKLVEKTDESLDTDAKAYMIIDNKKYLITDKGILKDNKYYTLSTNNELISTDKFNLQTWQNGVIDVDAFEYPSDSHAYGSTTMNGGGSNDGYGSTSLTLGGITYNIGAECASHTSGYSYNSSAASELTGSCNYSASWTSDNDGTYKYIYWTIYFYNDSLSDRSWTKHTQSCVVTMTSSGYEAWFQMPDGHSFTYGPVSTGQAAVGGLASAMRSVYNNGYSGYKVTGSSFVHDTSSPNGAGSITYETTRQNQIFYATVGARAPESVKLNVTKQTTSARNDWVTNNTNYNLNGTTYDVYWNDNGTYKLANDRNGNHTITISSTAGTTSGTSNTLSYSADWANWTVYLKETRAGAGYKINTNYIPVTLGAAGSTKTATVNDDPTSDPGYIQIFKDINHLVRPNGDVDISGVEYTVTQYYTQNDAVNKSNAVRHWVYNPTMTTENSYIMLRNTSKIITAKSSSLYSGSNVNTMILPLGWYTIKETDVSKGKGAQFSDNTFYLQVYQDGNNAKSRLYINNTSTLVTPTTAGDYAQYPSLDNDMSDVGKLRVRKGNAETATFTNQGINSFAGIRYAIVNRCDVDSPRPVVYPARSTNVDRDTFEYGEVVAILTTNASGITPYTDDLEYGTYDICELRKDATIAPHDKYDGSTKLGSSIYANDYYIYCDKIDRKLIDKENPIYTVDAPRKEMHTNNETYEQQVNNAPIRSDAEWVKYDIDGHSLPYIPFMITLTDTNGNALESHVIITDKNGEVNTKERRNKSATAVNTLDQYYVNGIYTGPLDDTAAAVNVWFGDISQYPNKAIVNNERGSLLVGNYIVTELKTDINAGDVTAPKSINDVKEDRAVYTTDGVIIDIEPYLGSIARDVTSDSNALTISSNTTIEDTIDVNNVIAGEKYKIITKAYNETKSGDKVFIGESDALEFTPEKKNDTNVTYTRVVNTFDIDSSSVAQGTVLYLVDYLYHYNAVTAKWETLPTCIHNEDNTTESQKLFAPEITSEAINYTTKTRQGSLIPKTVVGDTITYSGFGNKNFYEMNIRLADDAGNTVNDVDGKACNYTLTMYLSDAYNSIVKSTNGTILAPTSYTFNFDDIGLTPWTVDKTSDTYHVVITMSVITPTGEVTPVLTHNDSLDVVSENIPYLIISTTAGSSTGIEGLIPCDKEAVLTDIIDYSNCVGDTEIIIEGEVVEQSTGAKVTTNTKTDTIHEGSGSTSIDFTFDSTPYADKKLVVFEKIYTMVDGEKVLLSDHSDITDTKQTVRVPSIHTELTNEGKDYKVLKHDIIDVSLVDTVKYSNLKPGITYTMTATLYDKVTGEPVIDAETNEVVTNTVEYTPEEENGTVEVPLTFKRVVTDITESNDAGYVAFEKTRPKDEPMDYATHTDIKDEGQTVTFPKYITKAANANVLGNKNILPAPNQKITDTISLINFGKPANVEDGDLFTLVIEAHDSKTGEAIKDANGKPYTNTKEFRYKEGQKTESIDITIDATGLEGKIIVFYETLYYGGKDTISEEKELIREDNKDNLDQSVYVPTGHTTALDGVTSTHQVPAKKTITIVDTITYENLAPGFEYEATGVLYSAKTGKPYEVDGKQFTNTIKFTPETPNGEVKVPIEINTTNLVGSSIVVFEDITYKGETVFMHHDLTDKNQTVHVPNIRTKVKNKDKDNENLIDGSKKTVTIVDTVSYSNLIVGEEYTVTGKLAIKPEKDGDEIKYVKDKDGKEVTSEKTFVAESENGTVEVEFTFSPSEYAGKKIVVFEKLYYKDIEYVTHADIEDKEQTIPISLRLHVKIAKADKDNVKYFLKGAEITIWKLQYTDKDGNEVPVSVAKSDKSGKYAAKQSVALDINGNECIGETNENGEVDFTVMYDETATYYAQETKAPSGYNINKEMFEIKPSGEKDKEMLGTDLIKISILDGIIIIPPTPKTGDILLIVLGAIVLLGGAGVTYSIIRRKKKLQK